MLCQENITESATFTELEQLVLAFDQEFFTFFVESEVPCKD